MSKERRTGALVFVLFMAMYWFFEAWAGATRAGQFLVVMTGAALGFAAECRMRCTEIERRLQEKQ